MRKWIFVLLAIGSLHAEPGPQAKPPKLVLAIVIDQFRYDYLTRFRDDYTGGLKRLLEQGAVFTNAHYVHWPTVTAVGNATFLSGATPALSGIIGDTWWDREIHKRVTSVSDDSTKLLGAAGLGSSPRRLLQSTLGDELKISGKGGKVIGVSIKDRSAILPSGHMADGAYWFDGGTGNFVSSTYYFAELPRWVEQFNHTRPADKFIGQEWMGHKMPAFANAAFYNALNPTPYGNELIEQFALRALADEKLGETGKIDLLTVGFSSNDYVGHAVGPDSPEVRDMAIRVDKLIGELIRAAEAQAGAGNVLVVVTADHGVAPVPEVNQHRMMPGGRIDEKQERNATREQALTARFGAGHWIVDSEPEAGVNFDPDPIPGKKLDEADEERTAAEALRAQPHVFRVYTRTQLLNGAIASDMVDIRVRNGFNAARSGNLIVIHDPYWIVRADGTTHGTPFDYDAHVPVLFLGAQVRAGRYDRNIQVNDIAPTLATMLDVETPSGSVGRVLEEMLK